MGPQKGHQVEVMKISFLRVEWPNCPTVEVSGEGHLEVDGEEATAEEFTLALARIAQTWKDSVKPPDDATSLTACLVRGPLLAYWTEDTHVSAFRGNPGKETPSPTDSPEE